MVGRSVGHLSVVVFFSVTWLFSQPVSWSVGRSVCQFARQSIGWLGGQCWLAIHPVQIVTQKVGWSVTWLVIWLACVLARGMSCLLRSKETNLIFNNSTAQIERDQQSLSQMLGNGHDKSRLQVCHRQVNPNRKWSACSVVTWIFTISAGQKGAGLH